MGALAHLMLAKGHKVTGSDLKQNQLTAVLSQNGAQIFIGHEPANILGADYIVYSSAVKADNPEMVHAHQQGIKIMKRAQLLAELMRGQTAITIAGAHGKTTTTAMIANLLNRAGFHPTTAVGGLLNGESQNAIFGDGKYFVAEVDESDGSFLLFSPKFSVITNIDFEHVDYYHTWENILKAYNQFIGQTVSDGLIVACGEDDRLRQLLTDSKRRFMTYGLSAKHDVYAEHIRLEGYNSFFDCVFKGENLGTVQLAVPGQHNVLNALACIAIGLSLSIDFERIRQSLKVFRGVQRRLQLKASIKDILVIDDYGHHPT